MIYSICISLPGLEAEDMQHEQAWTWLLENVELKLKSMMGTPQSYEKASGDS